MKNFCSLIAAFILLFYTGNVTAAEKKSDFPEKAIEYIVGFTPGGKTDIQARGIAPFVKKYLGAAVNIQNFPGAGGRIGYTKLFKAKPDGYTIGLFPLPAVILGEYLAATEYKSQEFTPIFACFVTPQVLVVPSDTYQNIDEFIKAGKSKSLSNATPGHGTSSHLAGIVVANGTGLREVRHVHFESSGPSIAALAGKHVDFSVTNLPSAFPLVRAGKLKPLLVISDERDSTFPQVPTPKELGLKITTIAGIEGVAGPPHLPLEKVKMLEEAFSKAAADPEFLDWARKAAMNIVPMDHEKFRQATVEMAKEVEKYRDVLLSK
jgi:tripartite-type tricarboxylate transporter receptor subunit TctC